MGEHHDVRFPGESDDYRRARDQLLKAEIELRARIEAVGAQRRELPLGGEIATDYEFEEWDEDAALTRTVRMSELFEGDKDTLFLYSFMFLPDESGAPLQRPCPLCTSIIDAIDGQARHITQRINLAVCAKAPIERFHEHARARGWRHARLLCSAPNTYNRDYQAEDADGDQWPQASVFVRRGGKVHHFWSSELWLVQKAAGQDPRHVDFMWPLWAVLDRTPGGRGDFHPELRYG